MPRTFLESVNTGRTNESLIIFFAYMKHQLNTSDRNHRRKRGIFSTLSLIVSMCVFSIPVVVAAEETMEEVEVVGQKPLFTLEQEEREAQIAVYDIFNKLNTDDRYDVDCYWEKPLGTNFRHWVCIPGYMRDARIASGQQTYSAIMLANGYGVQAAAVPPPEAAELRHFPILIKKMQEIVDKNPELADAIKHHMELMAEVKARKSRKSD